MPYYETCPYCGDNLDPGEKCNCAKEKVLDMGEHIEDKPPKTVTMPSKNSIPQR